MSPDCRTVKTLPEAVALFEQTLAAHPHRDALAAEAAALDGRRRELPAISIFHLVDPSDTTVAPPEPDLAAVEVGLGVEGDLARRVVGLLEPLKMLNPVRAALAVDEGPGTLVPSFGIPLNREASNSPAFTIGLDEALAADGPDPAASGLLGELAKRIGQIRSRLPETIKIAMPDLQGPYNLAHAIVGEDAMIGPLTEPEKFHALMDRITDFWIAVRRNLLEWIGPQRLRPLDRAARITECSVNLISAEMYCEHVLPYDRRIAEAFGAVAIHPCSGPHVFHATLENLPHVVATEAGWIAKSAAGAIRPDEALAAIGDRPILLQIGQELPAGQEYDFIRRDLERCRQSPRLLFGYTGMHWRRKDRPHIRELHQRLDAWWAEQFPAGR